MYRQIGAGPSIFCVNQSFAIGFLKTLVYLENRHFEETDENPLG